MNPSFGLKIKTNKSLHLLISVAIANASISLLLNNSTSTNNRIASIWRYQFWNKKQFGVENSQICNFNSFLFPNRLVIHAKGKNATPSYLVKMGKTHKKKLLPNEQKTLGSLDEYRSPAWCRLLTRSPANSTQIDKN